MGGQDDIRKYCRKESQFQSSISSGLWNVSRGNVVYGCILYCQSLQKTKKSTQHWSIIWRGRRTRKTKIQPIHIFSASIVWYDCNIYTVYCADFDLCLVLSNVERYKYFSLKNQTSSSQIGILVSWKMYLALE